MNSNNQLDNFLHNLIGNVPIEEYDKDLLNDINKRFESVNDFGIELEKEFGCDLDGRLFLLFYRLACFAGYREIHLPEKLIVYSPKRKVKRGTKSSLPEEHSDLGAEVQEYLDAKIKDSGDKYTFGENKSLQTIKIIVGEYRDTWLEYYANDEGLKEECELEILDRVFSIKLPVFSECLEVDDLVLFSVEMFDLSVELAVCAYMALQTKNESLSWVALSKAGECLGLCMGAASKAHKDKTYIARKKGPYRKKVDNDFIKNYLIKKVNEKTEEAKNDLYRNTRPKEDIVSKLMNELFNIATVMHDKMGKVISPRNYPVSGGTVYSEDVLRNKIDNWVDGDPVFKQAIDDYIAAKHSTPFDDQINEDWICIKKNELERIRYGLNTSSMAYKHFACNAADCSLKQEYSESCEYVRNILRDPLFLTLEKLKSQND